MNEIEVRQMMSEVETLRLLLEVHEETAMVQAKLAEQALEAATQSATARQQQAQQMYEVIEASGECVIVMDRDWCIHYMNAQAKAWMSDGVDLVGRNLLEVYPRMISTSFFHHYEDVMRNRIGIAFEEFYEPRERWYSVNVAPVGDGITLFFRDVTERRRHDALLQRTEKLAAVGRLASSISHEINNPLESVVNLLYLIEHAEGASGQTRTYAALAASELARVSHIVTHTLKFHRQSTRAAESRISEIIESVLSLFQGRMATLNIQVRREFTEEDVFVCFAADIRQVFANLIGNALDALRGEGTLWLRTRVSRDWKTGEAGLRVLVADSGCGMSEATRLRVFEAFFTTKQTTGTGLGLWVSDEIIRKHKGVVRVRSSEGVERRGTVFSIFFPAGKIDDIA